MAGRGPSGIGKTQLLRFAMAAAERGARARGAGTDLETDLPFGIARQLLEPPPARPRRARCARLGGPARRAAAVLDLDGAGVDDREPSASGTGLYWLVANLAADAPLLALDDVQWVDGPSLRSSPTWPAGSKGARRCRGARCARASPSPPRWPRSRRADTPVLRPAPLGGGGRRTASRSGSASPPRPFAEPAGPDRRQPVPARRAVGRAGGAGGLPDERRARRGRGRPGARGPRPVAAGGAGRAAHALAGAVVLGDDAEPGPAAALAEPDARRRRRRAARWPRPTSSRRARSASAIRWCAPRSPPAGDAGRAAAARRAAAGRARRAAGARGRAPVPARRAAATRGPSRRCARRPGGSRPGRSGPGRGALRRALAEPAAAEVRPALPRELGAPSCWTWRPRST